MITNDLPTWLDAGKDIHDPRLFWDWIMFNIRSNSIIFSKQIAFIRRKQEDMKLVQIYTLKYFPQLSEMILSNPEAFFHREQQ